MLFFKKKLIRHMTKPVNPDKDHFGLWLDILAWILLVEVDSCGYIKSSFH
jgi:hypothetical protein